MTETELLRLLWAIFLAEGDVKASVPFGWLPLKAKWRAKEVSFRAVLKAVAQELRREWRRWRAAKEAGYGDDFVRWLARKGYNANPAEWAEWERNVRNLLGWLEQL